MNPVLRQVVRAWRFLRFCYFQFALHTCITMLEPMEERMLNSCLLLVVGLFTYVIYTYLPGHLYMLYCFTSRITHAVFNVTN